MALSAPRRGWLRAAGLVLGLLAAATVIRADFKGSYETAIKAVDRKDWSGAIQALKAAVSENPTEGERVLIYGMRYKVYLPHYYLGLAYFNSGNCAEAVKSLEESDRQGAIHQQAEYKDLQRIMEQCKGQLPRPVPPTPAPALAPTPDRTALTAALNEAEREVGQAEKAAARVSKLRGDPAYSAIWQNDSSLKDREARAGQDLAAARAALADARSRSDQTRATSAKETAARAKQSFEALATLLSERKEAADRVARAKESLDKQARDRELRDKQAKDAEAQAAARRALDEVTLKVSEARRVLADADRRQPPAPSLSRPRADLAALVAQAERATVEMPVADLGRLRDRLDTQAGAVRKALVGLPVETVRQAPPKPPAFLVEAATAYFQGDYAKAARLLEAIDLSDQRAAAQAFLFRSAAAYSAYVLGGEKDKALRERSQKDATECRRLDPKLIPSPRAFSPRFADFFERGSTAGRSAS